MKENQELGGCMNKSRKMGLGGRANWAGLIGACVAGRLRRDEG
jgi:hypothetical protein